MGFSISWLAIRNTHAAEALSQLKLQKTESRESIPESPVSAVSLDTGWFVVFFNEVSPKALKPEALQALSAFTTVVTCQVEEHVMVSSASEWRGGKEIWYVMHDAEDGLEDLDSIGELPPTFESIRETQLAKQASGDADYVFDVPINLAQSITGFRHDIDIKSDEEPFMVLRARQP